MRALTTCAVTLWFAASLVGPASAQKGPRLEPAAPLATGSVPAAAAPLAATGCANPVALGVTRTVEIDTTGGPGFGFEHFDEAGRYRADENGLPLDTSGQVVAMDGTPAFTLDGLDDLIVGAGATNRSRVRVLDGATLAALDDFFAFTNAKGAFVGGS